MTELKQHLFSVFGTARTIHDLTDIEVRVGLIGIALRKAMENALKK
ncbi:hypothetical protein KAR91_33910 [Candidatus Pacearchaeota archaeon]|nr:hypothetical protein [Candidatus Pacearchaeota archaeon]